MKVTLSLFFFLLLEVSFGQAPKAPASLNIDSLLTTRQNAPLGKQLPPFTAVSKGQTFSNDLLKGKVVLINFWFEACHPCMMEMEALNELNSQLKNNNDFLFISFTFDNPTAIKRVKEKYGITFQVLSVNSGESRRLNFENGYPTNIVIDRTGTIRYVHTGGFAKEEEAEKYIINTLLSKIKAEL